MRQDSFLSLGTGGFHRIAYTDWGDPLNPHVAVCVHGLARNSRDFDFLAAALERDCRVVCMDVAGRGESDWLEDKSEYNFSTYLSDAAALLARVTAPGAGGWLGGLRSRMLRRGAPQKLDWIGTSMGGLIGILLAAKPGSPIRRLVLNDVGPFVPWAALFRMKGYVGRSTRFADLGEVEAYLRTVCVGFGALSDAQWAHLARYGARAGEDGGYALSYDPDIGRNMRGHLDPELPIGPDLLRGIDLWSTWDKVACPMLVLRGAESEVLLPETLREMQRRKPELEVIELAGVGHAPALMSAEQIAAVQRFLLRP
ncbi:MAG: alpha/beta hydrolase [Betaproteobacteria bacterium]|nr:alpha/beta hydrolase [Betaproteobacteria bacterium]